MEKMFTEEEQDLMKRCLKKMFNEHNIDFMKKYVTSKENWEAGTKEFEALFIFIKVLYYLRELDSTGIVYDVGAEGEKGERGHW